LSYLFQKIPDFKVKSATCIIFVIVRRIITGLLLLGSHSLFSQFVQIGEGYFLGTLAGPMVVSTTAANYGCRFAYIYPKSVLGNLKHGDSMESMEFLRSAGAAIGTGTQLSIWLRNTSRSDFGSGRISFSGETTSATRVYNATHAFDLDPNESF